MRRTSSFLVGIPLLGAALAATASAATVAAEAAPTEAPTAAPTIQVENDANLPAAELESILRDFRPWAARVYAYQRVADPAPVTLKLSRKVPFGFYSDGTVLLPPSKDRWEMLDNWVHELTHHAVGHDSSFFFKEGAAVHTLEKLFGEDGRVPATWPQFGRSTDQWVALYVARGRMPKLPDVFAWPRYLGSTPEQDFRSWQIYNLAGSFTGWYRQRYGFEAWQEAFDREWPAQDSAGLQREWLADVAARRPAAFDPEKVLPMKNPRYRGYAERLKEP